MYSLILSEEKKKTLDAIAGALKQIAPVKAIVLGGSHCTHLATESSDLDIGIYYSQKAAFDIEEIRALASKFSVDGNPTVTSLYGWGPWVNGGAWMETAGGKVDLLYRNIEQVVSTIEKAKSGEWMNDFDQQPPYGYSSIFYLGETEHCIPLYDPEGIIGYLKSQVRPYPHLLKESVTQQCLWAAEFSLWHADYFLKKGDIYNLMGCLARTIKYLTTVLFSINEIYPMGDKNALKILGRAQKCPPDLKEKAESIFCADRKELAKSVKDLRSLFEETAAQAGGCYKPAFKLKRKS